MCSYCQHIARNSDPPKWASTRKNDSDHESQHASTLPGEKRDDIVIDSSSEKKSSDDDSDSNSGHDQEGSWLKHVTRSGHKTELQYGWLDPSTGGNMRLASTPIVVAMSEIQHYYDWLQEIKNTKVNLSTEVTNAYVEYSKVDTGTGGSLSTPQS